MFKAKISKTQLKPRIFKKTNPEIAAVIYIAVKNPAWIKYAKILSAPTRKHAAINLDEIDKKAAIGDTILVPGKVLSRGEITKKVRICSFSISKLAKEKLKTTKSDWVSILKEMKENSKAEGLKVLR